MNKYFPKEAHKTIQKLKKNGFEAYAVGGCVRDMLIRRKTKDWDFTTNATPEQIQKLFPDSFYDNKFGTVGVPIETKNGKKLKKKSIYEITTYRSEYGYSNYRHPDKISWGETLEEDLKRRDFTVNAICFDGKETIDLYEGKKDLKAKLLKAVGDPDLRFKEDALRMMRAVRLATELGFVIEKNTFAAVQNDAKLLEKISKERIRDEIIKIFSSDYPTQGVKLLRNSGLMEIILPEFEFCFKVEQKSPKRHHVHDVGTHALLSLKNCPSKDPIVRLACLLHDIGKAQTYKKLPDGVITFYNHELVSTAITKHFARKYRFSKKDKEKLITLVRYHQFSVDERQTDKAIRRFIRRVGKKYIADMLDLRIGDRLGGGARETSWRLELFKKRLVEVQKQPFSINDLKVNGHDVMKIFKVGSGPMVGKVLEKLFSEVENQKIKNQRKVLLTRIKEMKEENFAS